ncbi:hypothetical protein MOX02_46710 [Methylobacterium oxalidis]|uniref:Uncharacterized protein n=1 Tax=Methylobacterium oxalidis TaxID=944322 RepID=A0A512J9J9_9HYPH|nr:hypothetical protein MOX02_46710 [Methylobacterium oxalidis]GLS66247.1 hypothetical protein GCM10007888_46290 [Methylobacterium oxalidis]
MLALATENAELRLQLAEAQEQCVEMAVDAGELHAEIETLRERLAEVERERDERHRVKDRAVA